MAADKSLQSPDSNPQIPSCVQEKEAPTIFANIVDKDGKRYQLDAAGFGHFMYNHFGKVNFIAPWTKPFLDYYDSHCMKDVRQKLCSGMDAISTEYVELHDKLLNLLRMQDSVFVDHEVEWTKHDYSLFDKYKAACAQNANPLLKHVGVSWGTSITNLYGLYDAENFVPGILSKLNGKAVIDGGGYVGDSIVIWREIFPQSKIHTFEPSSASMASLCKLVDADIKAGNVIPVQKGLGDVPATLKLNKMSSDENAKDAGATMKMDYNSENYEEVEVITIDQYVAENNLEVGLIKLDVEGFEPEVIKGALNTIKTQRPAMVIACYHTPEEFYELKSYIEDLGLNYHFEYRRTSMTLPLCDLGIVALPM